MAEKINFSDKSRNVRAIFSKDGSASFVEISDFQESSIGAFCSAGISPGRQGVLYAELPDGNRHAAEVTSCENSRRPSLMDILTGWVSGCSPDFRAP